MKPLTRRATTIYRQATKQQLERGANWYPEAHRVARNQASEYGVTIEVASGVLASLSPRLGWGPTVMLAERMLHSRGTLNRGALSRSLQHARAIYSGTDPLTVLRGPKTRAFYMAILTSGESGDPVIDRHAWDMLVGKRGTRAPNLGQYRAASECMKRAGKILGVSAHEAQATTWVAWREKFWSPGAYDPVSQLGAQPAMEV